MDPTALPLPTGLAGPLTAIAAAGTAVAVLTEVAKQYIRPESRLQPPFIAGAIAAVFTAVWVVSQPVPATLADAFTILMIWFGLFQASIAVYHGTKLSQGTRLDPQVEERIDALRSLYEALLAEKDRQLVEQRSMIQVVPLPVPAPDPPADLKAA